MPLPTPIQNESQQEFIARCVQDDQARQDFPNIEQRSAVCFTQWMDSTNTKHEKNDYEN